MPLIYNEKQKQCNIMIFDHEKARRKQLEFCISVKVKV